MNGQLRHLPGTGQLRAAPPVTIAAQRIYVGKNPCGNNKIGLLAGLPLKIESDCNSFIFKTN
jgi:hypothetical protein